MDHKAAGKDALMSVLMDRCNAIPMDQMASSSGRPRLQELLDVLQGVVSLTSDGVPMPPEFALRQYLRCRKEIELTKTYADDLTRTLTGIQDVIESRLRAHMAETGENFKGQEGTAFTKTVQRVNIPDWDGFLRFLVAGILNSANNVMDVDFRTPGPPGPEDPSVHAICRNTAVLGLLNRSINKLKLAGFTQDGVYPVPGVEVTSTIELQVRSN